MPQVPLEIDEDLTLEVKPVKVLDFSEKELRSKRIPMIKVLWRNSQIEEVTWEREFEMRKKYPDLFLNSGMRFEFRGRNLFFLRGKCKSRLYSNPTKNNNNNNNR